MYAELRSKLEEKGLPPAVRNAIRRAKVLIIDDHIDDLQSMIDGLRNEGFTHLLQKQSVNSVNEILEESPDLIVLDLRGVAQSISSRDGIGILAKLKAAKPDLLILVVSGSTTSPEEAPEVSLADAIRAKPILPADLASEVDDLLKLRRDRFWAAFAVLEELAKTHPQVSGKLGLVNGFRMRYLRWRVERAIQKDDLSVIKHLSTIASIVEPFGAAASSILGIVEAIRKSE